jgi:hypothetical protein
MWLDFHQAEEVIATDLQPASEPIELRGSREFTLIDPDGYRLVFLSGNRQWRVLADRGHDRRTTARGRVTRRFSVCV